jgi:glutamine synthetase
MPELQSDEAAMRRCVEVLSDTRTKRVRFAFVDLHGETRCKTLLPAVALRALRDGITVAGTTFLKDTSDHTALPVWDVAAMGSLAALANAANLIVKPDPATVRMLPWAEGTAWILGRIFYPNGRPCELDARQVLKSQVERLHDAGYRLRCGVELEFHVYRIRAASGHLDPDRAAWPGPAPEVDLIHPGYRLLSEQNTDAAHEVSDLVESVASGLGIPLASFEVEFGPSQFEAVFDIQDAAEAADNVVLFRSALRQVLARHGFYATFVCRPPFKSVMSSGWHVHQSLVDQAGHNVFHEAASNVPTTELSLVGKQWLAGLMDHALEACLLGTSNANGYARYQPGALAPTSVSWGYEDRAALFRVVGHGPSLRIENRLGEPSANPYLYLGSQIICGLDGIEHARGLGSPRAKESTTAMPSDLGAAIRAFDDSALMKLQLGAPLSRVLSAIKTLEWKRFGEAEDTLEFSRREYFARY